MPVVCAAVVGPAVRFCSAGPGPAAVTQQRGPLALQNNPLYLEAFYTANQEEALKFHYIVHCALDAVEEKGAVCSPALLQLQEDSAAVPAVLAQLQSWSTHPQGPSS